MKYEKSAPAILKYLSEGYSQKDAARKANISERTLYEWLKKDSQFFQLVQCAREEGEQRSVVMVESALLDIARGFEYEEVRTEYESRPSTDPNKSGKFELVVKKRVSSKKRVVPNIEAIKFFLANRAPERWKNRLEQTNLGGVVTSVNIRHVGEAGDEIFPSSEDEVDAERTALPDIGA